jgi:multidrug efflux pump subunit AcrB
MWIVRLALIRPYTFVVMALLILVGGIAVAWQTPKDIFPNVDIPVISVAWNYTGMNAEEFEGRITTPFEKVLTALVDNIERIESTTMSGQAVVKIFLQPGASLDTANAQVGSASQFVLRQLPPSTLPPEIINFSASTVPIVQLALSGEGLSEQQENDLALNVVRTQLITVPGAVVPLPYGGKQRQVMINLNFDWLQAKGLAPSEVLSALANQNVVLPSGTAKIGGTEYDVRTNAAPRTVTELAALPIKQSGNATIFLGDVATVSDGFAPQTNVVRQDGHRGVLATVMKTGSASTLDVIQGLRDLLPRVQTMVPPALKIEALADQSVFVRAAIQSVIREGIVAGALTALLILLFLGSWRSTLIIAISIPLSILCSLLALSFLHQTINLMTLGGLALAVGILVDDATVEIENIERNLAMGYGLKDAILRGASQIAVPAFVSTLCICIVFAPMFFLHGVARYLFVPLAEAVVFAMLASYLLSRTLVPTLVLYFLRAEKRGHTARHVFARAQQAFERAFETVRDRYEALLTRVVSRSGLCLGLFFAGCAASFLLVPWLGQNFFPEVDGGQFLLHLRAKTGTRIEETARLCDEVAGVIRAKLPAGEVEHVLDNIGLPYSPMNLMHSTSGVIGAGDADILVTLTKNHRPTIEAVRQLRRELGDAFPGVTFSFLPADMTTQILNFGLPAPLDVQVEGSDVAGNRKIADQLAAELRHVPGIVDVRIQQPADYPVLDVDIDRTRAVQNGLTARDAAGSILYSLSGSFQYAPMFFLNRTNGVAYNLVAQTPQYAVQSLRDLESIPIGAGHGARPAILGDVASIHRSAEVAAVSHRNVRRVIDLYASVQDRDLGAVGREVERLIASHRSQLPRGSFLSLRGQYETMRRSYFELLIGLGVAVFLVYLLIVVNFQSWTDPFIIVAALPAALAGIVLCLFICRTELSVPALMGAIMCIGVATANSVLVVSFAREQWAQHGDAARAAIEAGRTRLRPVLMTALAMMIGMLPSALGWGEGAEQNAPLGRAVIGGLFCATFATLFFVPALFSRLNRGKPRPVVVEASSAQVSERMSYV